MILLPTANPALFAHSLALREVSLPSEHLVRVKDGVSKALYFVCDYSRVGEGTGKQKQDLRCNFDLTSLQPFTGTMFSPFFSQNTVVVVFPDVLISPSPCFVLSPQTAPFRRQTVLFLPLECLLSS